MPSTANLNIFQGDDYIADVTVTNADGSAADLTGYVAQSQIRVSTTDVAGTTPAAQFTCTIATNVITIILDHTQTSNLTRPSYFWDLQVIDSNDWITTLLMGQVNVTYEVTKLYTQTTPPAPLEHPVERVAIPVQIPKVPRGIEYVIK